MSLVRDSKSADVKYLWVVSVFAGDIDTTKRQRLISNFKLFESSHAGSNHNVSLCSRLKCSAPPRIKNPIKHCLRFVAHRVKGFIGSIKESLFLDDFAL